MPASRSGSQQVGGIEFASDKPSASYQGCVWDATRGMYVPSTVPVVRRHSGADVTVPATYSGITTGSSSFGWTPTGVVVGDVQIIAVRTAAFGTITPGASWGTPIQTDSAGSGGGWGHEAIYSKVVTAGDLAAQSASATVSSVWTVHYIRGLASAPVAGDVTASNAVVADPTPYAIGAITGSLTAPKFLVVQAVSWPTTSSNINLPPETENVLGGYGNFSGNNTAFVKSGLIRQAAAATSQAYTGSDFTGENIVIALTPVTAAVSLSPVDILNDVSDVDTFGVVNNDSLFYNSVLAQWKPGRVYPFKLDLNPVPANAQDDEFDGVSVATWTNTPTAPTSWTIGNTSLNLRSNGNGTAFVGKYQSIPASYPFTVETKIRASNMRASGASFGGLIMLPATPTGASACCTLHVVAPLTTSTTQRNKWSAMNGGAFVGAATDAALTNATAFPRYLRWVMTSATSMASYSSMDGILWRTIETGFNPGFTPGVVGLFFSENSTADGDMTFDYFRVS